SSVRRCSANFCSGNKSSATTRSARTPIGGNVAVQPRYAFRAPGTKTKNAPQTTDRGSRRKFGRERSRGVSAMSTPPEKPVNSIDPFGHVSHETRERVGSEHHPIEGNSEPTRSPYAPTRARERTNAEHISQENDHDAVLSRYAPKKARTQPVQGPDVV